MGYRDRVRAVHFGGSALDPEKYFDKRNEIWGLMDEWLDDELPVQIPDDDGLHAHLMGPRFKYDSNHRKRLESKESMRSRGVRSPNDGDALALTFSEPVEDKAAGKRKPAQAITEYDIFAEIPGSRGPGRAQTEYDLFRD
jgi:hypothetical protein